MFLDLADCGTTWSNPQTSSTSLVVIDLLGSRVRTQSLASQEPPPPGHVTKFHILNWHPLCVSHTTHFSRNVCFCQKSGLIHDTCFFFPGRNFFTSCRGVTRRKKFWLCTGRPPLPNWGLTRPPNMPKVSPGGAPRTLDGLCTEDAPTGSIPSRRWRWHTGWRGDDVAASSAAGTECCRR